MENLNEITNKFNSIQEELLEIGQSRSNFALVHFVVGRHGNLADGAGPRMRYQALRELRNIKGELVRGLVDKEKKLRDIKHCEWLIESKTIDEASKYPDLDIIQFKSDIEDIELRLVSLSREADTLVSILEVLPKYTYEEHQDLEVQYWIQRLSRQMIQSRNSRITGYDRGDIESIGQACGDELLDGIGKIETLPLPQLEMQQVPPE